MRTLRSSARLKVTKHTLHPTPYTLHPTPYTLHPTPYTLHPTPCTLHPTPHTLHTTHCTIHPTPCTLHPTPYTLNIGFRVPGYEPHPRASRPPLNPERRRDNLNGFKDVCTENGSIQGQNLALTVLYVPYSLDGGPKGGGWSTHPVNVFSPDVELGV